ncbi:hypothetical protein, partial [Paenibacillus sp. Y412MC10]|uniref:hypothetical protein n=1 Tax=Geobacillus sp. (strain Y412MC10) TaxID=481743 RepID=UPI0037C89EAB
MHNLIIYPPSPPEPLILPPTTHLIHAAHNNPIPLFPTLFFPQTHHPRKIHSLHHLLNQPHHASFPLPHNLIHLPTY